MRVSDIIANAAHVRAEKRLPLAEIEFNQPSEPGHVLTPHDIKSITLDGECVLNRCVGLTIHCALSELITVDLLLLDDAVLRVPMHQQGPRLIKATLKSI